MMSTTDIPPLHRVRLLSKPLSSEEVAKVLNRSGSWVRKNKHLFTIISTGRNLGFELSSVLEYHFLT